MINGETNVPVEFALASIPVAAGSERVLEVDVEFSGPAGASIRVPAFQTGNGQYRVRFAAPQPGNYRWRSVCRQIPGFEGKSGELVLQPYTGDNPLYRRGPVRVAANRRHFEHADGTPFFWLGDTWWMGLTQRLRWPKDFKTLSADRTAKGFSVIQIVAGLYPDMAWYDERGTNEAGYPWEKDFSRLNPAYFDQADRRIRHLVEAGLVPCIVGCWGYFLPWMGLDKMKQHWRNLVARWGAYPVMWCLAGEGSMPYYLTENREQDKQMQEQGWSEIGRYVREIDPWHRPVTIHPSSTARDTVSDESVLDFDMLQTGHGDRSSIPNTIKRVSEEYVRTPTMPVVEGEVCYEGIGAFCGPDIQRWLFWACMLNGACGYTYGANGIWQLNTRAKPYGPSPHGMTWGNTPWEDAYRLPGAAHVALAKRWLERYPWWQLEPHPEWVEPGWQKELNEIPFTCGRHDLPVAAGIPRRLRIIYCPMGTGLRMVKGLEPGVPYRLRLFDPLTGVETEVGEVAPDAAGNWPLAVPGTPAWCTRPIFQDWVYVLEADGGK